MTGDASTSSKNGDDSKLVTLPAFKYELMLRVIGQLQQGKSINWTNIHCGDKAKKTLSNMWVKVRAEIAALDPPVVEESAAVKTPRSAAKKRTAKTQTAADESDSSPSKKPKKTLPVTPAKAQAKPEEDEEPKKDPKEDSAVKDEVKDEIKDEEE